MSSFESALQRLRRSEIDEDCSCFIGRPKPISNFPIEYQFAEKYTRKMFFKFQAELLALIELKFHVELWDGQKLYLVEDGDKQYKVQFNCHDSTFECECHKFETAGIICRHALLVYREESIRLAPEIYVLDRWAKCNKVNRDHLNAALIAKKVSERRNNHNDLYSLLQPVFLELVDFAMKDESTKDSVVDGLNNLRFIISKTRVAVNNIVGGEY